MLGIHNELDSLIEAGRELLSRSQELAGLKRQVRDNVGAGVDILDLAFDLTGYKRTAKRFGRLFAQQNLAQMERTLETDYRRWFRGARTSLQEVSVYRKNLTSKGNSRILLKRLSRTSQFSRIETRIRHALGNLEGLLHEELIPNSELSKYLRSKNERVRFRGEAIASIGEARRHGEVAPSFSGKEFWDALATYPSAEKALMGALSSYESQGPDANRQSLASCRIALENIVREASDERDWNGGLRKLVPSKAARKFIKSVYHYLSSYGIHGPAPVSDLNARIGIQMTLSAVAWILGVAA